MLGHSQIGITLDLYSHVTATMQQHVVEALDGLFGGELDRRMVVNLVVRSRSMDHKPQLAPVAQWRERRTSNPV